MNTNHPQFRHFNTITTDDNSIKDIPIGKAIVLPEKVSLNKDKNYSGTYGYDIIEGILVVGYEFLYYNDKEDDEDEVNDEDEEGLIINNNFYDMDLPTEEYNDEDEYIYKKWDKMVMYREELKAKLNEAAQCIPIYDGVITV